MSVHYNTRPDLSYVCNIQDKLAGITYGRQYFIRTLIWVTPVRQCYVRLSMHAVLQKHFYKVHITIFNKVQCNINEQRHKQLMRNAEIFHLK